VTSQYAVGDVSGTVGIIGAKRMDYPKMIPLVDYIGKDDFFAFSSLRV